jgi:UPF0716 protein FxsA
VLGLLTLVLILVPIAELYVIIQVGHVLGVVNTLGLLLLISFVGAWLMKREGLNTWRRAQAQVQAGVMPGRELVDGALILLAGALLLAPGFITDFVGLLLLLPPVRSAGRAVASQITGLPQKASSSCSPSTICCSPSSSIPLTSRI